MAYTALQEMREINARRFGRDVGPAEPALFAQGDGNDLKSAALRFLHNECEGLRFSSEITEDEKYGSYYGASFNINQIPYNMQMDIDRLCLERELDTFIDSGAAEDAYTVYYCFLEMFIGRYGASQNMIEMLSQFESNASSLLMKHRDHYSHSVYVFAIGLALYETNSEFRRVFKIYYGFDPSEDNREAAKTAAAFYLEFWGLTALFHDIGYPFEIPFEQVMAYFEIDRKKRGEGCLCITYETLDSLINLDEDAIRHFGNLYCREFHNTNELLAFNITDKLGPAYGFTEEDMLRIISDKPGYPEKYGYFMDHAYFSSARLYQELVKVLGAEALTPAHIDALSAIMLHNSLFKFNIAYYKDKEKRKMPLPASLHPLAYMLMICDELQCWDRTAYGRNSRTELHPMAVDFDLSDNKIKAVYYYDIEEKEKIDQFRVDYNKWEDDVMKLGEEAAGDPPRLKAYSDMNEKEKRFTRDIEHIVDTSIMPLDVIPSTIRVDRTIKRKYLSVSNFLHLYDFAVVLNARYNYQGKERFITTRQMEEEFNRMSLEYKLSNIHQARGFDGYLNAIGCFYTDQPVDFDMVHFFTREDLDLIAPMEHERWVREHGSMGWRYGDLYENVALSQDECAAVESGLVTEKEIRKAWREQTRQHKLAMDGVPTEEEIKAHYDGLSEDDQGKDWKPMNSMLRLIKKYDGLRIYRLYSDRRAVLQ